MACFPLYIAQNPYSIIFLWLKEPHLLLIWLVCWGLFFSFSVLVLLKLLFHHNFWRFSWIENSWLTDFWFFFFCTLMMHFHYHLDYAVFNKNSALFSPLFLSVLCVIFLLPAWKNFFLSLIFRCLCIICLFDSFVVVFILLKIHWASWIFHYIENICLYFFNEFSTHNISLLSFGSLFTYIFDCLIFSTDLWQCVMFSAFYFLCFSFHGLYLLVISLLIFSLAMPVFKFYVVILFFRYLIPQF